MFMRRVCDRLLGGGPFEVYGDGGQSRSFTYVGDAVEATVRAMEKARPGSLYNVGGGEEASVADAIALLERIAGRTLAVRHVAAARGDVARTSADVSRIAAALGWRPRTTLAEGLAAMWSWASDTVAAA
jgi:UDP-glucuronate 4-epimerase